MIHVDEVDSITQLFAREIKINVRPFAFPPRSNPNLIDTHRELGKDRKYFVSSGEGRNSALHLRKRRRKMADAISREISDKAVSYTRRASEKPSARHTLPLCSFLLFQGSRRRTSWRVMLVSIWEKRGGKKKEKNSSILPPKIEIEITRRERSRNNDVWLLPGWEKKKYYVPLYKWRIYFFFQHANIDI